MFLLSEVDEIETAETGPSFASPMERLRRAEQLIDALALQASVDELTGVMRRGAGLAALEREFNRAIRSREPRLVLAFVDIDRLKAVNDRFGHAAGDELIRTVAGTLRRRLRSYDLVIRWGGDEFVCALPESDLEVAAAAMQAVADTVAGGHGHGFSFGLASLGVGDNLEAVLARADSALYEAKKALRND